MFFSISNSELRNVSFNLFKSLHMDIKIYFNLHTLINLFPDQLLGSFLVHDVTVEMADV